MWLDLLQELQNFIGYKFGVLQCFMWLSLKTFCNVLFMLSVHEDGEWGKWNQSDM